jgi:hypothetical protein
MRHVGLEFEAFLEFLLGFVAAAHVQVDAGQVKLGPKQRRVNGERLLKLRLRFRKEANRTPRKVRPPQ